MRTPLVLALALIPASTQAQSSVALFDLSRPNMTDTAEFTSMLIRCDEKAQGFEELMRNVLSAHGPLPVGLHQASGMVFAATRTHSGAPTLEFDLGDLKALPHYASVAAKTWATTQCGVIAHEVTEYSRYLASYRKQAPGEDYLAYRSLIDLAHAHAHAAGIASENSLRAKAGTGVGRLGYCNEVSNNTETVYIQIGPHTETQTWVAGNLTGTPTLAEATRACEAKTKPLKT